MKRVEIGGFCLKGNGHIWTYEEGADGCSGWPIYVEIDPEDVHMFPEWVQECYRETEVPRTSFDDMRSY